MLVALTVSSSPVWAQGEKLGAAQRGPSTLMLKAGEESPGLTLKTPSAPKPATPSIGEKDSVDISARFQRRAEGEVSDWPDMYCQVQYSTAGVEGIQKLAADGSFTTVNPSVSSSKAFSGCLHRNRFYSFCMEDNGPTLTVWNTSDWNLIQTKANDWSDPTNIALASASDGQKIYGTFFAGPQFNVMYGYLDPETLVTTKICDVPATWRGCAFDKFGNFYAVDHEANFVKVDKLTGETTVIGNVGIVGFLSSSMVIDPATDKLYWNVCPEGASLLFEINKETAEITYIHSHQGQEVLTSLFIPENIPGGAPAEISDLAALFAGSSLSGNVTFTMPSLTYEGSSLSGDVSYKVTFDNVEKASGKAAPGTPVSVPVTLTEAGYYQLSVELSNAAGKGPGNTCMVYVGNDTPVSPEVTLSYASDTFSVSWNAVEKGAHDGYVDPSKVTYDVVLMPGNISVAEGISATTATYTMPAPDTYVPYWAEVTAKHAGLGSVPGVSSKVGIGAMPLPYEENFADATVLEKFTIVDANDDGNTWFQQIDDAQMSCNYNSSLAMDDWLISPAVKLEKDHLYIVGIEALSSNPNFPERVEVKTGTAPDAASMVTEVLSPVVPQNGDFGLYESSFIADASGNYFMGIHGISDPDMGTLTVSSLRVSEGYHVKSPGAVTALNVVKDPAGALKASVTMKAPTVNVDGTPVSSISKIEVYRDGELVRTFSNPLSGATLAMTDTPAVGGMHHYMVRCLNANGAGLPVECDAFIGDNVPAPVSKLYLVETESDGEVTLYWDSVDKDTEGNDLVSERVRYRVYSVTEEKLVEIADISGNEYTWRVYDGSGTEWARAAIVAYTTGGESAIAASSFASVGKPQPYPWSESAPDCVPTMGLGNDEPVWYLISDSTFPEATSQDGDNGFYGCQLPEVGNESTIYSHLVDLDGAEHPTLGFATFNVGGCSNNEIFVMVRERGQKEWTVLKDNTVDTWCAGTPGWKYRYVPLEAYKGKQIQVGFRCKVAQWQWTFLDNISIEEGRTDNVALHSLEAPAKIMPGEKFSMRLYVENNAVNDAEGIRIEVTNDAGFEPMLIEGIDLKSGEDRYIDVLAGSSPVSPDRVVYDAQLFYEHDEFSRDNNPESVSVRFQNNTLPVPMYFGVLTDDEGFPFLAWEDPELSESYTEGFEDYLAWDYANGPARWTVYDGDMLPSGGVGDADFPNFILGETTTSFWVFDSEGYDWRFTPHGGTQFLASIFPYNNLQNNDWAISPELSGEAQTITFFGHSFHEDYVETLRLLYSTGGNSIADFVEAGTVQLEGLEWKEFSFDVPQGAKYFAFNNVSNDQFMTMIDDVTYIPAQKLQIIGYNVYRDGVQINLNPLHTLSFTDRNAGPGEHTYTATTLYNFGESRPAPLEKWSGVKGVQADGSQWIRVDGRTIVMETAPEAGDITVTNAGGIVIFRGVCDGSQKRVDVPQGIYIVKCGAETAKVMVM